MLKLYVNKKKSIIHVCGSRLSWRSTHKIFYRYTKKKRLLHLDLDYYCYLCRQIKLKKQTNKNETNQLLSFPVSVAHVCNLSGKGRGDTPRNSYYHSRTEQWSTLLRLPVLLLRTLHLLQDCSLQPSVWFATSQRTSQPYQWVSRAWEAWCK